MWIGKDSDAAQFFFDIRHIAATEAIEVYDPYLDLRLIFDEEGVKVYRLEVR